MYVDNNGLKEWRLDNSYEDYSIETYKNFGVSKDSIRYYSQQDEDKYIIQKILKDKITDGVFLELGACDGIMYSNTKTLEDYFGFSGILIEPIGHFYNRLISNRPNCEHHNCVVSTQEGEITFVGSDAEGGIKEFIKNGFNKIETTVKSRQLKNILKESQYNYIDIFILDVEGAELDVLQSIDFDEIDIYCIISEAHSDETEKNNLVISFLEGKGFQFFERQRGNNVFLRKDSNRAKYFKNNLYT